MQVDVEVAQLHCFSTAFFIIQMLAYNFARPWTVDRGLFLSSIHPSTFPRVELQEKVVTCLHHITTSATHLLTAGAQGCNIGSRSEMPMLLTRANVKVVLNARSGVA